MKPYLALYMGGMGAEDTNFHADVYRRMGYAEVVDDVTTLFRTDRKDEAATVIPDELVDDVGDRRRPRLRARADQGVGGRRRHDDGGDRPQRRADPRAGGAGLIAGSGYCRAQLSRTRSRLAAMTASQHTIAGTVLTMPVKIRKATQHTAMFSVDADAAQRMIDYSGLQVCRYLPGPRSRRP